MIDIHAHLLPAVDDGAADLEEAVEMCRLAAEDGCEAMVATPHQRLARWWNTNPAVLEELRRQVALRLGDRLRLHLGAEIRIDSELLTELERMPDSGLVPLAGSRFLLLEFARSGPIPDPEGLVHELVLRGWRPILAHPELISQLAENLDLMVRLADLGAAFQVTAMSLTGDFGKRAHRRALRMLDEDLVDFVASDTHNLVTRPPGLAAAAAVIESRCGLETARRLTRDNPLAVLRDQPLPALGPVIS